MYFAAGSVLPNSPLEIIYFTPLCTFFLYNIFVNFLSAAVRGDFVCLLPFGRQLFYCEFYVFSYIKHVEI